MKKIIPSIILILFMFTTYGQNEAYKTAKWRYYLKSYDFKEEWYEEMSFNKDTTMYGEVWQQFKIFRKVEKWNSPMNTYYSKTYYTYLQWNGSKVYYLPPYDSTKYLLLDFNAQAGDSWEFAPYQSSPSSLCPDSNIFHIDSIGADLISGNSVKWIKGHNRNSSIMLLDSVKIYQNMGMHFNIFRPLHNGKCMSDVNGQTLTCYEDTTIGKFILDSALCNIYDVLSLDEPKQNTFKIYPNPTSNTLIIRNMGKQNLIGVLTGLNGKILKQETVIGGLTFWDVSFFAEGIYFLTLNQKGEVPFTQKIIIQR